MSLETKRVAIIGAGISGLVAIKSCVEENLEPVCFEQLNDIGGIWLTRTFGENVVPSHIKARMFDCVFYNTSKEMSCFSDFPMPKEFPVFPSAMQGLEYFQAYTDHFGLRKYIQFQTDVISVARADDFDKSGKWVVQYKSQNRDSKKEVFDAVIVSKGIFHKQFWPDVEGLRTFQGGKSHSGDYVNFERYRGKTVLVVGNSFSAGDIACDVSSVARQTYISTREGLWVMPKLLDDRVPWDYKTRSYLTNLLLPFKFIQWQLGNHLLGRMDYERYDMVPHKPLLSQSSMLNDVIQSRLLQGQLLVKPGLASFSKNGVKFTDGNSLDIDEVIFCTGFRNECPFINDEEVYPASGDILDKSHYKYMFPTKLKHPTIAFLGDVYFFGAFAPVSELQARYAVQVFKGNVKLPSQIKMEADIMKCTEEIKSQWGQHADKVMPFPYQMDIANKIGVSPPIYRLFLTDPKLAWRCLIGGDVPAVYRLRGPGAKYELAREMIMSAEENRIYPYRSKPVVNKNCIGSKTWMFFVSFIMILMALMMPFFRL